MAVLSVTFETVGCPGAPGSPVCAELGCTTIVVSDSGGSVRLVALPEVEPVMSVAPLVWVSTVGAPEAGLKPE